MESEYLTLTLGAGEAIATLEAIHDVLIRRVRWSTDPDPVFRENCPLDAAQEVINGLITAYFTVLNTLRDNGINVHPEFLPMIHLSETFMDLIARITLADSWDQLDIHPEHDEECEVCETFART